MRVRMSLETSALATHVNLALARREKEKGACCRCPQNC